MNIISFKADCIKKFISTNNNKIIGYSTLFIFIQEKTILGAFQWSKRSLKNLFGAKYLASPAFRHSFSTWCLSLSAAVGVFSIALYKY